MRWLLITLLLFFAINTAILLLPAIEVIQTGMCPAAPPDGGPYPCNIFEFLDRMFFGGFALPGQILLLLCCAVAGALVSSRRHPGLFKILELFLILPSTALWGFLFFIWGLSFFGALLGVVTLALGLTSAAEFTSKLVNSVLAMPFFVTSLGFGLLWFLIIFGCSAIVEKHRRYWFAISILIISLGVGGYVLSLGGLVALVEAPVMPLLFALFPIVIGIKYFVLLIYERREFKRQSKDEI